MRPTTSRLAMMALVLALSVPALPAAAGDWSSPVAGGGGGNPFEARCGPDEHLIGLKARVGDDLDEVRSLCAKARPDGTRDADVMTRGSGGGDGGSRVRILCPDDAPFVRKLEVAFEGVDTLLVNQVAITCGPLTGALPRLVGGYNLLTAGGPLQQVTLGTDIKWDEAAYDCPDGLAAVGVHGRAGAMVDALGLMCGTIVTVTPPPPPPPRPSERSARERIDPAAVTAPPEAAAQERVDGVVAPPEPAAQESVGGAVAPAPEPPPMLEPKPRRGGIVAP